MRRRAAADGGAVHETIPTRGVRKLLGDGFPQRFVHAARSTGLSSSELVRSFWTPARFPRTTPIIAEKKIDGLIGLDQNGILIVVSHLIEFEPAHVAHVRIISARRATRREIENGERGTFYRENAALDFPIYLEHELQVRLGRVAEKGGTDMNEFVNRYLKLKIAAIEAENGS